jgi:hypothetical protein
MQISNNKHNNLARLFTVFRSLTGCPVKNYEHISIKDNADAFWNLLRFSDK